MAVKIRLKRLGKKHKPVYRVVVADSRKKRDGETIQDIGVYDPGQDPILLKLDEEKVKYWLENGAQPSEPMQRLLGNLGLISKVKRESKNQKVSRKTLKEQESK